MRSLIKYLKRYTKECILGPLFKLLEATFELFVPLVVAAMIDTGIAAGDKGFLLRQGVLLVVLALIGLTCSITAQYFAAKAAVHFAGDLRHRLFAHIQRLPHSQQDRLGSDTLITRMTSDINQVQTGVNLTLRLLLRSPFIVFGAMVMACTIDLRSAGIFLGVIAALSVVVFGIMLWSIPRYKAVQQRLDQVLGATRENLSGVRVLRAFGRQRQETERFDQRNASLTSFGLFVGRITALMNPLTYVLVNLGLVVLLKTGAVEVDGGVLTQGQVVALVNYLSQILVELVKMANLIINITKSWACGNRIAQLLSTPEEPVGTEEQTGEKSSDSVVFDHVSLTYADGGAPALKDISFRVVKNSVFGIIGGTGSGKSSVINLIPGFYQPTDGTVVVDGLSTKLWITDSLRQHIGLVPQKANLFRGTIADNLRWGDPEATEDQLWEALERAQAADFVRQKELGLQTVVEQGGRNFSGGQRQRLTIARALVRRPDILILDDSASALDYATDAKLRKALRELEDTTVFIVSQRTSSIRFADQILVLEDGQAVGLGTHETLLKTCPVYREIHATQQEQEVGA